MDENTVIDFLVVGHGIAGAVLTQEMASRNISFRIIDNHNYNSASLAAGGFMHPMSFKRLIQSWKAKDFITYAIDFYQDLEQKDKVQFFQQMDLYRPFNSLEQQNDWMARMNESDFSGILSLAEEPLDGIDTSFGVGKIALSGRLDIVKFLDANESKFDDCIIKEKFIYENLKKIAEGWEYKGEKYRNIVYCEGYQYVNNPFFSYLPNNATKGEILFVKSNSLPNVMLSKGCMIVPLSEDQMFLIGSTYKWNCFDTSVTEEGRNELLAKLAKVKTANIEVINQRCGIRPTTHDRRPLIGTHPKYTNVFIFNGMGSKTVMFAPLLAKQLLDSIAGKGEIDKEADIKRLERKHFAKFKEIQF